MCDFGYDKQLMVYDRFAIERDAYNLAPGLGQILSVQTAGSIRVSAYYFSPSNNSLK